MSVSVLTLTAISIERFFAICRAMKFINNTMGRARLIIGAIWGLSLLLFAPDLVTLETVPEVDPGLTILLTSCRPMWEPASQVKFQIFQLVAIYFVPLGVMGFAYTCIAMVLHANTIPTEPSACKYICTLE